MWARVAWTSWIREDAEPYSARFRNGTSKGTSIEAPTQNLESVLLPSTTVRV